MQDTAPDTDSCVWVGGSSKNETGFDWCIIKYDNEGTEIWNRTYDSDNVTCKDMFFFTDDTNDISTGFIFGAGDSYNGYNYDFRTVRFDSEGEEIWSATYDGGNHDIATAIGASDTNGDVIWNKAYDSGGNDFAYDITVYVNPFSLSLCSRCLK